VPVSLEIVDLVVGGDDAHAEAEAEADLDDDDDNINDDG